MPREISYLTVKGHAAHIGCAGLFAVLAYPDELDKRDEFVKAAKAWLVKSHFPPKSKIRNIVRKDIRTYANRKITNVFNRAIHRIQSRRLPAVLMAQQIIINDMANFKISIDNKIFDLQILMGDGAKTVNKSAEWIACNPKILNSIPNNIKHRIWSETKPVLHIVHSLHVGLFHDITKNSQNSKVSIFDCIEDASWLEDTLKNAEKFRQVITKLSIIRISDEDTISLMPE